METLVQLSRILIQKEESITDKIYIFVLFFLIKPTPKVTDALIRSTNPKYRMLIKFGDSNYSCCKKSGIYKNSGNREKQYGNPSPGIR